jgi:hypothetical protein
MNTSASQTLYHSLVERLAAVHRKVQRKTVIIGAAITLGVISLVLLSISAVESLMRFESGGRFLLLVLFIAVLLGVAGWFILLPVLKKKFSVDETAQLIGTAFPALGDRLLNALQIYRESTNVFSEKALARAAGLARANDFTKAVRFDDAKNFFGVSGAALLVTVIAFAVPPLELTPAAKRIFLFGKDFTPPPPFRIESLSKDIELTKGNDAELQFEVHETDGVPLPDVRRLSLKFLDERGFEIQDVKIFPDSTGRFVYKLRNADKALTYFAESDIAKKVVQSSKHRLTILDRPRVAAFQLMLEPPRYARLSVQTLEPNFGDASALRGTLVSVKLKSSKPLKSARLIAEPDSSVVMRVENDSAFLSFSLKQDMTYRLALVDESGLASEASATYELRATPDEPPQIKLVEPKQTSVDMPPSLRLAVAATIRDDYGFSAITLRSRISKSEFKQVKDMFESTDLSLENKNPNGSELERGIFHEWNLAAMNVLAGEEVEFYLEVFDNDAVSGFKSARTELCKLRLPSLDEIFKEQEKQEKETIAGVEKQLEQAKAVQEELSRVQDELRQKSRADWQDKKALDLAQQKQEQVQKNLAALEETLQKMTEQMKENSLVSEETLQKYEELQKMLEELQSPDMKNTMEQMKQALEQMNEQQIRESLKDMQFNEEQLKKTLERVKENLERMQITRKLDENIKRLDEMAKKQDDLKKETEQTNPKNAERIDELKKEQAALKNEEKGLQKSLDELQKKMDEFPKAEKMPLAESQKFNEQRRDDNIQKDLNEAEQKLSEKSPQEAAPKQQSASQKMQQQKASLQKMQQEMQQQKKSEVLQAMQNAVQSALSLSMQQEELMKQSSQRGQTQESQKQNAAEQGNLKESLSQLSEEINQLGKKSSAMKQQMLSQLAKAEMKMNEAMSAMEQRNGNPQQSMQASMAMLNEFASQTAEAMQGMMGQGKQKGQGQGEGDEEGEGDGEGMDGLAKQQEGLNQESGDMGQGEKRDAPNRQERLMQMAAQQRMIQQQLQEMAQKQKEKEAQGKSGGKLLGDMNKVAEDMEKAAEALERGEVSPELKKRQQQILSRMLESTKSLQKRDEEERREAKTAKNIFNPSPAELSTETKQTRLQDAVNRLKRQGFSDDYERLIRRYYDALEKRGTN